MQTNTAKILQFPCSDRIAEAEPQLIEQPTPTVEDSSEEAEILGALRKVGVRRIHGLFEREAWANTIRAAELYSMPFARTARANLAPIHNYAHELRASTVEIHFIDALLSGGNYGKAAIKHFIRQGILLSTLFPDFREPEKASGTVGIRFPRPPRAELQLIQRAQLAGFKVRAAVPGRALSVNCNHVVKSVTRALDPILFATRDDDRLTVVLGYYGVSPNDGPALKSLTALLDEMARAI